MKLGATVNVEPSGPRLDGLLFGESQSRALLTAHPDQAAAVLALFEKAGVPARQMGTVGGAELVLAPLGLKWNVAALYQTWDRALDDYLA